MPAAEASARGRLGCCLLCAGRTSARAGSLIVRQAPPLRTLFVKWVASGGACSPHVFRLRREAGEFCRGRKRRTPRLRNVVSTCMAPSAEISEQAFCREARLKCGGFGTAVLPHLCRPRSKEPASALYCREGEPPKEVKLPRRRPTHSRSRREAGFRARRPSRLHQRKTDGVTPLANAPAQETR
jgi:hypothetical protein